jgi:hypothetical protein
MSITAEAQVSLLRFATGYRISQMLYVAARLGIADLLASGPKSAEELALLCDAHAPSLYRALRTLASVGFFAQQDDGRFCMTALAEPLRSDVTGSLHGYVIMQGEPWMWNAWSLALHSVRTGEPAFNRLHGTNIFGFLDQNPAAAAVFNAGMTGRAASADVAIAANHDFSGVRTIVDVGGGHGLMLAAILQAWPDMRGTLLDRPAVADGARTRIAAAGLTDRCQVVGGDFFESVPAGADCYVLANVIHDWDDDHAIAILQTCHAAMEPGSRVLIVEAILPAGNEPHPGKIGDVQMLVITGGQERTELEFRSLLTSSGFTPTRVLPTASPVSIVEGVR